MSPNHIFHFRGRIDKVTPQIQKMSQQMTPKPSKIEAKRRPKTDCKSGRQKNDQKYEKVPKMVLKMVSQG